MTTLINRMNTCPVGECELSQMQGLIQTITGLLGLKTNGATADFTDTHMNNMVLYIKSQYKTTSIGEIKLAYQLYVRGDLFIHTDKPQEVFRLFDPVELGKVMNLYRAYRGHHLHQLIESQQLTPGPARPVLDLTEIHTLMLNAFQKHYDLRQTDKPVLDLGNAVYGWLDGLGLVPFNADRKWEFFDLAKAQVESEQRKKSVSDGLSVSERRRVKEIADVLAGNMPGELSEDVKARTLSVARQLAYVALLDELIEFGTTPVDFVGLTPALTN